MEGQAKTDCYLFMEEQEPVPVANDTKSIRTGDYCFLAICLCVLISVFILKVVFYVRKKIKS